MLYQNLTYRMDLLGDPIRLLQLKYAKVYRGLL